MLSTIDYKDLGGQHVPALIPKSATKFPRPLLLKQEVSEYEIASIAKHLVDVDFCTLTLVGVTNGL